MARNNMAVTTRINKALKSAKLEQRLVRGSGYYYVTGVAVSSSMYVFRLEPNDRDYRYAREHVNSVLREEGIQYQIP